MRRSAVDRAFAGIGGLVSDTIDEVRAISWNLRPSHLDQLGLRTALMVMTDKMSTVGSLSIAHAIDPCDGLLPPSTRSSSTASSRKRSTTW